MERYLGGQDEVDRSTVRVIQRLTRKSFETLLSSNVSPPAVNPWPYRLAGGRRTAETDPNFSASTQTMILHALAVSTGIISKSVLIPALEETAPIRSQLERVKPVVLDGVSRLIDQVTTNPPGPLPENQAPLTFSKTWGADDSLTLTWMYELLRDTEPYLHSEMSSKASQIRNRIRRIARRRMQAASKPSPGSLIEGVGESARDVPHPFLLLRTVQLARCSSGKISRSHTGPIQAHFISALNAELAHAHIRDGGFDPASLVFTLEGLLTLNPSGVADGLMAHVMSVIGDPQQVAAHWRPVHPISTTRQGLVLLPQSVEVANSVLRIAQIWEREREVDLFAANLPALRKYAEWAASNAIQLEVGSDELTGWQSEHTFEPAAIHLWATSQMVLFLEHFSEMLRRHVARLSRDAAGLQFESLSKTPPEERAPRWKQARLQEPLSQLPGNSEYACYSIAHDLYVEPRNSGRRPDYFSMLLYGPPGTGKTQFARAVAKALGYDYISISPSDFTQLGESGVEARAQEIFKVLRAQSRCVVLFDEIDRLLVDRDSIAYTDQGDIFQLMTPSMLTKINELRSDKNCIFIIATNYADRIDSAIKRPGRIDKQLLLLPPDCEQRKVIARTILADQEVKPDDWYLDLVAALTPLFIYKELHELVMTLSREDAFSMGRARFGKRLNDHLKRRTPTISMNNYRGRLMKGRSESEVRDDLEKAPLIEFALLAFLLEECNVRLEPWQQVAVAAAHDKLDDPVRKTLAKYAANGRS